MPQLLEFQQTFRDCILNRDMSALLPNVVDCKKFPINDRLQVYTNNVFSSLRQVLEEIFSRVRKLVGEECFKSLAYEFIAKYPPSSGCLAEYGARFPQFLKEFQPLVDYPYLADVAQI